MTRKAIEGYEGLYEVDEEGNVFSLNYGNTAGKVKKLKPRKNTHGYYQVGLWKDKKEKMHLVHRLVAIAFIANPDNKPQVDHINRNRLDNIVDNLQWVTNQQNSFNTSAKGCYHDKRSGKWQAYIYVNRKQISLKYHDTEEEAHAAYLKAKEKYHIIE